MNTVTFSLEKQHVAELSLSDMATLAGGHNETAYQIGHFIGECLVVLATLRGLLNR